MTSGLDEFGSFLKDFDRVALAGAGVAVAAPFLAAFASIVPPWPSGLTTITAVFQLIALIWVFHHFKRSSKKKISRNMKWAALVAIVSFLSLLIGLSLFVLKFDNQWVLRGFECTDDAIAIFQNRCPFLKIDDIAQGEYKEWRFWTDRSLTAVRISLVIAWGVFFMSFVFLIANFLVFHRRTPSRQTRL